MNECKNGCGYTNKHRGAMNIHESVHCKQKGAAAPEETKKDLRYCDCEDAPSWAFLSRSEPAQARAIAAGYKKICTGCGEVI